MQSLRTRRPSEARAKPARPSQKLAKPAARSQSARKSRVDDKIRKRMSMRYADISSPTELAVPAVPILPIGSRLGERDEEEVVRKEQEPTPEERLAVDIRILDKETFDPDAYLKVKLANSTEAELKSLQSSLQGAKDATAVDLRRNVFKNYAEFMTISKEISTLENDMLELKASLSEWKSMPSMLHIDDSASAADRRRTQRSSVADLRALYAGQLQALHAQIEGAAKLVPAIPGRRVIAEVDGVSALHPATYRVEHAARFVLLDDAVLVARRRERRTGTRARFVAERSWPLNDILVLDTKDTATLTNVFKIRHGKETHAYRTDIASDKKMLLQQFRQVADELSTKKRKEREGEHERRKSMRVGGGTDRYSLALDVDAVPAIPDWMKEFAAAESLGVAKEKADKDAVWVNELTDDLTVAIALQEWEKAVGLVEQGEAKKAATPVLGPKLAALTSSLTASLLRALSDPAHGKSAVMRLTGLLLRLHAGAAARSAFLTTRADVIRRRVRMIRFEGHVQMYISDLAIVMFTGLKHTADWFLASFKENDTTSCLVDWGKKQIENYADMFRKQVFISDVDQETIEECVQITQAQNRKLLIEYGLDFRFILDDLLVPAPKAAAPLRMPSHKASLSVSSVESILHSSVSQLDGGNQLLQAARSSPAPPPRSRNRPGSSAGRRPLPVVVPVREGML